MVPGSLKFDVTWRGIRYRFARPSCRNLPAYVPRPPPMTSHIKVFALDGYCVLYEIEPAAPEGGNAAARHPAAYDLQRLQQPAICIDQPEELRRRAVIQTVSESQSSSVWGG